MTLKLTAKLEGMEELQKVLKKFPKKLAERDLSGSLRKGANMLRDTAQDKVPVDQGDLRESIKVKKVKSPPGVHRMVVAPQKPSGWYAHMVEFGKANAAPQPFMRPTFDEKHNEVVQVVIESLADKVDKTSQKLAGDFKKSGLAKRKRKR